MEKYLFIPFVVLASLLTLGLNKDKKEVQLGRTCWECVRSRDWDEIPQFTNYGGSKYW